MSTQSPDDLPLAESRLRAAEERLSALEAWRSAVMNANPHLTAVLDPTPRGEASDE